MSSLEMERESERREKSNKIRKDVKKTHVETNCVGSQRKKVEMPKKLIKNDHKMNARAKKLQVDTNVCIQCLCYQYFENLLRFVIKSMAIIL